MDVPIYLIIFGVTLCDLCRDVLSVFVAVPDRLRVEAFEVPRVDQRVLEIIVLFNGIVRDKIQL